MGYVGNQTSNSYTSLAKQTITGDGGASYTLDHAVANVNEIEVFVNNVRQEPSVAYTVSGTALTMTGDVAASDDFYVVFQGKAIQTVVPPDDSVTTARINDSAVTTSKINDSAVTTAKIADDAVTTDKTDFYKEGTWTVEVYDAQTGGNKSSTTATGDFTRIGRLVHARFAISNVSTSGLTTGSSVYVSLPYDAVKHAVGSMYSDTINFDASRTQINPQVNAPHGRLFFRCSGDNVADTTIQVSELTSGTTDFAVDITFFTDDAF